MVQSKQLAPKEKKIKIEELEKRIADLTKELELAKSSKIENYVDEDDLINSIEIKSDKYIKVMSLTPYLLTLTTAEYGRGKRFDFHKFGEVKRILYHELVQIMEYHPNFLNEGYYVILDQDVVRRHGLDDVYKNILTKDKMEQILVGNQSDAVNLFKVCGKAQRGHIVNMIHDKMVAGESVDLNLLDRLSRIIDLTGEYSIAKIGEEMRMSVAK